jgi:pSer/pThr/pTyr-binding forkhead associated (FHA) protein
MPWKVLIAITEGTQRGEEYEFVQDLILIGRSRRADVVLNDSAVSVKHCQIEAGGDSVEIEDLMSKNGTFVNQIPIQRTVLKTGDRIQLGRTELSVRLEPMTATLPLSKPLYENAFIAGYSEQERMFLSEEIKRAMFAKDSYAFATGEELMTEVINWFEKNRSPGIFILDLKMPIINGINTAISLRAYERAYQRPEPIPIVFFFDPPDTEAFQKVLSFCSPSLYYPRQTDRKDFDQQARLMVNNLKRSLSKGQSRV